MDTQGSVKSRLRQGSEATKNLTQALEGTQTAPLIAERKGNGTADYKKSETRFKAAKMSQVCSAFQSLNRNERRDEG